MTEYSYKTCPICGIHYAVDKVVMDWKRSTEDQEDRGWHCPNGHRLVFRESDADKYRREAERLRQRVAERDDQILAKDRQLAAAKGQLTKVRNRAKAGVCPCCNRTFQQLARHMKDKHPDFKAEVVEFKAEAS